MSFKEILGQEIPVSILKNSLKAKRVAHAYLFLGEEGVGKKLAALNLAKVLNCEKSSGDACDCCVSCQKIERFLHPDVKWLEPDGFSRTIKLEHILELQREIYLKPFEGRKKIFVLLEAERMNREAANAFLKTLEEPPGESILILISTSSDKLLPTIKSRCQTVRFSLIPEKLVEKLLREKLDCEADEARNLSLISGGRPGEAVRLKKEGVFAEKEKILDLVLDKNEDVLDIAGRMVKIWDEHKKNLESKYSKDSKVQEENLDKKRQKVLAEQKKAVLEREYRRIIDEGIEAITLFFRDCLVWKITGDEQLVINQERFNSIKGIAQTLSRKDLKGKISTLKEIKEALARNAHLRLALTVMLLKLSDREKVVCTK